MIGPSAILVYEVSPPEYHVPADHDDLIAASVELVTVAVSVFVAFQLVAVRLFRAADEANA